MVSASVTTIRSGGSLMSMTSGKYKAKCPKCNWTSTLGYDTQANATKSATRQKHMQDKHGAKKSRWNSVW